MTCVNFEAFDYRNASREQIDNAQDALRAYLAAREHMFEWPHNDQVSAGYPPADVKNYCVLSPEWQKVRVLMKGIPTHEKLQVLKDWWDKMRGELGAELDYVIEVQVGNYLGALRRGGQLNGQNQVRRYI